MPHSKFSRACLVWFFSLWLAAAPAAALIPQAALAAPGTDAAPVIRVSAESAAIGEWIDVTLENGPAGHQGYFTADTPLAYAAPDGTPQEYPYRVTIGPDGRATVRISAASAGYRLLTFEDMTGGSALPAMHLVKFTHRMLPGIMPEPQTPEGARAGADKPFAFIYAWRYPPGTYFRGVPTPNIITVNFNLQGKTGNVLLLANYKVIGSSTEFGMGHKDFTVDMGSTALLNGGNNLSAAVEVDGRRSDLSKEFAFTQLPGASLINGIKIVKPFVVQGEGNDTRFVAEVEFPDSGMRYSSPGFLSTEALKQTLHAAQFKGALIIPVLCDQPNGRFVGLTADASYASTTNVWAVPLAGSVTATGRLDANQPNCALVALELVGTVDTRAQLSGSKQWEMRDFYKDTLGSYFTDTMEKAVKLTSFGTVGFSALLAAHVRADANVMPRRPYFTADVRLDSVLDLKGKLDTWVPPLWRLTADMNNTGGKLFYNSAVRSSEFQQMYASVYYSYHTDFWYGWVWGSKIFAAGITGECAYNPAARPPAKCEASAGTGSCAAAAAAQAEPVRYGGTSPVQAAGTWSWAAGTPQAIMSGIYPFTDPGLAVNPDTGDALLLWDHDDMTRPWGQSAEILARRWDGAAWSDTATLTADAGLDMHPQVAWTANGKAVAVWEHVARALPEAGAAAADTLGFEIATAVYDAAANTWSAPELLTGNAAFDGEVRLARNAAGQLMAVWVESDAGIEPTGGPARIMAAFYDGGWSAPMVAVPMIDAKVELAGGYGNGRAGVAFTQIMTPTGGTGPLSQLLFSEWDGSGWSQPVPVAPAVEEQHDPNVVYNAQNEPLVVYFNCLLHLRNMATGAGADLELDPAVMDPGRLMVTQDGDGNLLALFRNQMADDFDLYTARFDVRTAKWSPPRRLTTGGSSRAAAAAVDADGTLHTAYVTTAYTHEPATLTFLDGSTMTTTEAVARDSGLSVLGYTYKHELTVPEDGLEVSDLHPQAGATVILSGTVQNTGDLPEPGVTLHFYDGDPNGGGVLIATVPVPGVLAAGDSVTLSTPYVVPLASPIRTFFVTAHRAATVAAQQAESVQDPQASVRAFGPDWALASAAVLPDQAGVAVLRATVQNVGTQASPLSQLRIFAGDVNNPPLVEIPLPVLQPGEIYIVAEPWHVGAASPQSMQLIVQVGNPADELDTADSMAARQLPVGPDLVLTPFNIEPGDIGARQVPVTVTVFNIGPVVADKVEVQLHREGRRGSGDLLDLAELGPIAPGEAAAVVMTVEGPLNCGVFASVIAAGDVAAANNYASITGPGACNDRIYLPRVSR